MSESQLPDVSRSRRLRVFLCHASSDKAAVRDLCQRLKQDGFQPWLDEEELLPGQDWQVEIPKAVRAADVVIVCLSSRAINREGYVQKEIKFALDAADEKPEGTIFLVPLKLEPCDVPERLARWQWVDLFQSDGYKKLTSALQSRARSLGIIAAGRPAGGETAPEHGFVYTEFASVDQLSLVNSAGREGGVLRITPAAPFTNGAAWCRTRHYVELGFDTIFQFRLTKQDQFYGGGDGLAFVIQDSGDQAIGGFGASLGFGTDTGFKIPGIPNSLAVVVDTFLNPDAPFDDPSGNHVAVHSNGNKPNNTFSGTRLAGAAPETINFKDGSVHSMEVNCVPEALEVLIDTRLMIAVPLKIAETLTLSGGKAFLGFTAATASSFQNHDILSWAFRSRPASV